MVELMKNDEKWWKMIKKNEKNSRKIAIFHFLDFFAPLEEKMIKKWLKNEKKMKKNEK